MYSRTKGYLSSKYNVLCGVGGFFKPPTSRNWILISQIGNKDKIFYRVDIVYNKKRRRLYYISGNDVKVYQEVI